MDILHIILLASVTDSVVGSEHESNIDMFSNWLKEHSDSPDTKLVSAGIPAAYSATVKNINKQILVNRFHRYRWFVPDITLLIINHELYQGRIEQEIIHFNK
jgi:hypothetical protein